MDMSSPRRTRQNLVRSMDNASAKGPLVSIVVPTCHRNHDLVLCLSALESGAQISISSSTVSPVNEILMNTGSSLLGFSYEVIVTDDGSSSTAEAVVREKFPWARWLPGPRKGPAANRNSGAQNARGEWVFFLDDDCIPNPGWIESCVAGIHRFPECSVFEGQTIGGPNPRTRSDHESPLNLQGGLLWSCNFGIKRQLFLRIGGFDESFPVPAMEDMDLQFRLKELGYASKFLFDACAQHPWRPKRGTHFCIALAKSVRYFIIKHPEARPIFADTWGIKRMIKIITFEFPRNLVRFHDLSAFRVLYLDLLTAFEISRTLPRK
jgi:GT2 family glycosyltransferase